MTDIYVCKESAAFEYGGDMVVVHKGVTRVRAGHPMLRDHPELFDPIDVHYDWPGVEQATAAPGEKRAVAVPAPTKDKVPAEKVDVPAKPAADDVDALREQAESVGVRVDKRWGADKLRAEIAAAGKGKE
jgi:hypothetical protein